MTKERGENPVKLRVITDMPFRRWDTWVDGKRNHIFVMPADGGAATDITPGDVDSPIWTEEGSEEVAFSPDSREICFSRYVENEALTGNSDLFVMPADGGTPKPTPIARRCIRRMGAISPTVRRCGRCRSRIWCGSSCMTVRRESTRTFSRPPIDPSIHTNGRRIVGVFTSPSKIRGRSLSRASI